MASPRLFSSISIRSLTIRNRLWIAPMCQYCVFAEDGIATPWHFVHLGSRAVGGAGLILTEATSVEPRGRISARDLGLWNDGQAQALEPITRFIKQHGAVPAVQLAHAGRKARVPGCIGPSPLAFSPEMPVPQPAGALQLGEVVNAFRSAALRALDAGFEAVEVHAAHGYLLHEFLSPLSNHRDDGHGGSFENRIRLALEVVRSVRAVWPERLPLFVRVSATDWVPGGWDVEECVELARRFRDEGVDLVDTSSGGLSPDQQVQLGPGYQVPFAARIRREAEIATGAVGLISEASQAERIITEGDADAVLIGRQSLRDPYWPLRAARALGEDIVVPTQYERGWL